MAKIAVDECPAGAAMDAAVAETLGLVMRWEQWVDEIQPVYRAGTYAARDDGWAEHEDWRRVLPYSADIAAAWELVQASHLHIGPLPIDWDNRGWYCADDHDFNEALTIATGETAPLAICRAFLKANSIEFVEVPDDRQT